MTTALDYRKQVSNNKPAKAFRKTRKVYGDRMEDAPAGKKEKSEITTDFNELIRLQIKRSEKHQRAANRFIALLGLAIIFFFIFYFSYSLGVFTRY